MRITREVYQYACTALGVLAPVGLFVLVMRYAVNVPVWDEWGWVALLFDVHTTGLSFVELWAQHNEHRIVFPALLMLALDRFGGYNIVREAAVNVVLAVLTLIVLVRLMRAGFSPRAEAPAFCAISLTLFSMNQAENWLWGYQMAWFLVNLCAVGAVALLTLRSRSAIAFIFAVAAAVVASFSVSSGLLLWPAGLLLLLGSRPLHFGRAAVWFVAGAVTVATYLHGYVKPPYHPSTQDFLSHPFVFFSYILTYFGSPFAVERSAAAAMPLGLLLLILLVGVFIAWARAEESKSRNIALGWLTIAAFAVMSGFLTAIGRSGFGVDQALAGRYVTVASLGWIGALGAFCVLLGDRGFALRTASSRALLALCAGAFAYAYVAGNTSAIAATDVDKERRVAAYAAILDVRFADDATLRNVFPDAAAVRSFTQMLVRIHDGPFR